MSSLGTPHDGVGTRPESPRAAAWLLDFCSGLVQPTPLSLLVAIVVAIVVSVACATIVTEAWMAEHGALFTDGQADIYGTVTREALALATCRSDRPAVLLAGSLTGDRWSPETDPCEEDSPRVVDLRTPSQTMFESLGLADQFPTGSLEYVVLVVTPETLRMGTDRLTDLHGRSRIGVRSAAATVLLMQRGVPTITLRGNYFVDNQAYLLSRTPIFARNVLRDLLGMKAASVEIPFEASYSPQADSGARDEETVQKNLESLDRLLGRIDRRSLRPTFVVFWTPDPDGEAELRERVGTLVGRHGGHRLLLADGQSAAPEGLPAALVADLRGPRLPLAK